MSRILILLAIAGLLILIDFYAFQGLKAATQGFSVFWQRLFKGLFFGFSGILLITMLLFIFFRDSGIIPMVFTIMASLSMGSVLGKIFYAIILLFDDARRGIAWISHKALSGSEAMAGEAITRSEFIAQAGAITAAVPLITIGYGIANGAHDYRVRERELPLSGLPKAFDGMKLVQISDIHTGSFWSKKAVLAGMDLLMEQKPDAVFFTGDIVNNVADEMKGWTEVFSKIKAPLGVYSTLGNHDYGDYVQWSSPQAKRQNLDNVLQAHKELGWDLLLNEHRKLRVDGEELTVVGVENWSNKARFPKYGDLNKALQGTDKGAVKLLLSHDPSHWRAQVLEQNPDIKATFSGHTHGMQFGVEIAGFKWSPVKYMYPEWADLYTEGNQHLYVNRGFGYIGYPGRIGILPEISLFTLKAV